MDECFCSNEYGAPTDSCSLFQRHAAWGGGDSIRTPLLHQLWTCSRPHGHLPDSTAPAPPFVLHSWHFWLSPKEPRFGNTCGRLHGTGLMWPEHHTANISDQFLSGQDRPHPDIRASEFESVARIPSLTKCGSLRSRHVSRDIILAEDHVRLPALCC